MQAERITNMPVSFIACPQNARLTEARMTFQQASTSIATCWKHLHAKKSGNLFEEKIYLKIVSALIFSLDPFPLFTKKVDFTYVWRK